MRCAFARCGLLGLVAACAQAPRGRVEAAFPKDWLGSWVGEARGGVPARPLRFRMELHVALTEEPSRVSWRIVYGEGETRQARDYALVVRDAVKGDYAIDENDGTVLDAQLVDGVLWSHFVVAGRRIVTRHALRRDADGDFLEVEMASTGEAAGRTTGADAQIRTWQVETAQSARLRRAGPR